MKNKLLKTLLPLSVITSAVAPIACLTSCGHRFEIEFDGKDYEEFATLSYVGQKMTKDEDGANVLDLTFKLSRSWQDWFPDPAIKRLTARRTSGSSENLESGTHYIYNGVPLNKNRFTIRIRYDQILKDFDEQNFESFKVIFGSPDIKFTDETEWGLEYFNQTIPTQEEHKNELSINFTAESENKPPELIVNQIQYHVVGAGEKWDTLEPSYFTTELAQVPVVEFMYYFKVYIKYPSLIEHVGKKVDGFKIHFIPKP